jgi:hypothetical protein
MRGLGDMNSGGRSNGKTDGHNGDSVLPGNFFGVYKMTEKLGRTLLIIVPIPPLLQTGRGRIDI